MRVSEARRWRGEGELLDSWRELRDHGWVPELVLSLSPVPWLPYCTLSPTPNLLATPTWTFLPPSQQPVSSQAHLRPRPRQATSPSGSRASPSAPGPTLPPCARSRTGRTPSAGSRTSSGSETAALVPGRRAGRASSSALKRRQVRVVSLSLSRPSFSAHSLFWLAAC